jgi:hypothetical protein
LVRALSSSLHADPTNQSPVSILASDWADVADG